MNSVCLNSPTLGAAVFGGRFGMTAKFSLKGGKAKLRILAVTSAQELCQVVCNLPTRTRVCGNFRSRVWSRHGARASEKLPVT